MKLNLGCGEAKLEGYVNIDINPQLSPDLVHDISEKVLPYADESVEHVTIFHTIEHIKRDSHAFVFGEINRVLEVGAKVLIAFPNAPKCMENALTNKWGMRDYWEKTICGRGLTIWDCHRSLIFLDDFIPFLKELGFFKFKVSEEVGQSQNAIVEAVKVFRVIERSDLIKKEVKLGL